MSGNTLATAIELGKSQAIARTASFESLEMLVLQAHEQVLVTISSHVTANGQRVCRHCVTIFGVSDAGRAAKVLDEAAAAGDWR